LGFSAKLSSFVQEVNVASKPTATKLISMSLFIAYLVSYKQVNHYPAGLMKPEAIVTRNEPYAQT
jgi:hypothetical protein